MAESIKPDKKLDSLQLAAAAPDRRRSQNDNLTQNASLL